MQVINKEKIEEKKEWNAPHIEELGVDNTESGTQPATGEGPPFYVTAS